MIICTFARPVGRIGREPFDTTDGAVAAACWARPAGLVVGGGGVNGVSVVAAAAEPA